MGLLSERAELVIEVAALVSEAGGEVVPLGPGAGRTSGARAPAAAPGDGRRRRPGLDAVIVDAMADPSELPGVEVRSCAGPELVVVHREGERELARSRARGLGAGQVVALPGGRDWLRDWIHHPAQGTALVGVQGAVGGAGASTVAIALALARRAMLVDLDVHGAGVHLPLGLEDAPGIRWPELPVGTRGPLDPQSLLTALPRFRDMPVVCGDVPEADLTPVWSVLATARTLTPSAVVDLGRTDQRGVLSPDDWVVLVVPTTIAGVVAAARAQDRAAARVVLAVREAGSVPVESVVAELGSPPAVRVPKLRRAAELADCGQLVSGATGRALLRLGEQLHQVMT